MGRCLLCQPPTEIAAKDFADHMRVEHDVDLNEVVEKWPDGDVVVHDLTLEPEDFNA